MARKRAALDGAAQSPSKKRRLSEASEDSPVTVDPKAKDGSPVKLKRSQQPKSRNGGGPSSEHIRFSSEDDTLVTEPSKKIKNPIEQAPVLPDQPVGQSESDDEAPDTISTATAQDTTKKSLANITKAVTSQRTAEKRKRKERDERLKVRSTAAKNASSKRDAHQSHDIDALAGTSEDVALVNADAALPDLLPPELLEAEFTRIETPSPPPPSGTSDKAVQPGGSKRKMIFPDQRKPRDKQVGPVNVSVLEKESPRLPPKANKSKKIRESWMKTRLDARGRPVSERRPVKASFVRT